MVVNRAINKAIPVIASERDKTKSPIKELVELANSVYEELEGKIDEEFEEVEDNKKRRSGLSLRLGR
jgi:uncharacterized coiled-coil DUF342 family protein